jgi:uncharacterized protein with von Willebrand factor type A (vWA) domain
MSPGRPTGEETALGFVDALRGAGVPVSVGASITYLQALSVLSGSRDDLYWAGRSTLVPSPERVALYDSVFADFWAGVPVTVEPGLGEEQRVVLATDDAPAGAGGEPAPGPVLSVRYSPLEVLRAKDFAAYDDSEMAEARRLMADLDLVGAPRRSRRRRSGRRRRGRPDLRGTLRAAMRTGGEALERPTLERRSRPRRLVLLLDVSGSMETYSRALLRFVHAAASGPTPVEAFAFGTRLTRLTRELATRDPDTALARVADAVPDWSGGTRLGESLRRFNDTWGVRGMARGAVVVILSDGWDRGDPDLLTEQMARLRRVAHRLIWVNPLKAGPDYAPLAQGMAAALPFVDEFVEGHSLDALQELARVVAR